jgi:hypothetical protein
VARSSAPSFPDLTRAPSSPLGSTRVARWAAAAGLAFESHPDERWFRRWEPHETLAPPSFYLNSCTFMTPAGHVVLVEPWYAAAGAEPLERTVLAFAVVPALPRVLGRAAARMGEHFLTRVAFLESAPLPEMRVGDAVWDEHVKTFASSETDARAAFHPRLRKLLSSWGFAGHLEVRPGGLIVHYAGLQPTPEGYDRLLRITREILAKATAPYPGR